MKIKRAYHWQTTLFCVKSGRCSGRMRPRAAAVVTVTGKWNAIALITSGAAAGECSGRAVFLHKWSRAFTESLKGAAIYFLSAHEKTMCLVQNNSL
jgi:hypothetical protein